MAGSSGWRVIVILVSICILIGGIASIVSNFQALKTQDGFAGDLYTTILLCGSGGLYVLIGLFGLIAGITKNRVLAAMYFFGLLVVILIIIVAYVIAIVLVNKLITDEVCEGPEDGSTTYCDVDAIRSFINIVFIVFLAVNVVCCGIYAICAGVYWRKLVSEAD
eukprot:TRINITY_DN2210_c0_g1_i1.p1 TRINITY_DN2210_c0_g1~~TRINITY_DN2210_c0_g1_i1.p1  ORF type:complete len:172 (+),score=36.14 TRINITY_DN2210_c0_g1_i1:25-516(+)